MRIRRLLGLSIWPLIAVVFAVGCSARSQQPEVVGVEYETRISGEGVIEGATVEESQYGTRDEVRAAEREIAELGEIPANFTEEGSLRVLEVASSSSARGTRMVVQLSRSPEDWKVLQLVNPSRCVVDLDGPTAQAVGPRSLDTGDARISRLRIGRYPDRLRLVADQSATAGPCSVAVASSAVVFSLGDSPDAAAVELWRSGDVPAGAHAHAAQALSRGSDGARAVGAPSPAPAGLPYTETPSGRNPRGVGARAGPPDRAGASGWRGDPYFDDEVAAAPRPKVYTGSRISLEFKDADILNVLRIIADVAHRNIVATDDVSGRVTIVLYDIPWDQALEILLKSTGLEMVEYEDVITISTAKRLEEERKARLAAQIAGRRLEPLHTAYLRINYVKARELAGLLQGRPTTSAAGAMAAHDMGGGDAAGVRRGLLSGRGSVMVNDATNTLIVRDVADGVANARELVRRLDVQTPQVAIQGLIFEAETGVGQDLGVRWGTSYIASPETGNPTGRNFPGRVAIGGAGPRDAIGGADPETAGAPILFDFPAKGVVAGAGSTLGLVLGSLDGSTQIDAEITALEQQGKGKVISRPKIITLNNAEAQIQSLEIVRVRNPSTGTVINTGPGGSAGGSVQATQAIDTGIILRVTPQVSSDGYVLMQLFVKSSKPNYAQRTDDIPSEISRQATSQVLVRDGETVVIGGVYRQRADLTASGVPWLMDIPLLGWLFKNRSKADERQELLVFITPRVVWRTMATDTLPDASSLWRERGKSAYRILGPDGVDREPNPISALPG